MPAAGNLEAAVRRKAAQGAAEFPGAVATLAWTSIGEPLTVLSMEGQTAR